MLCFKHLLSAMKRLPADILTLLSNHKLLWLCLVTTNCQPCTKILTFSIAKRLTFDHFDFSPRRKLNQNFLSNITCHLTNAYTIHFECNTQRNDEQVLVLFFTSSLKVEGAVA